MTWENSAITITTLLPLVGALVIVLVPKDRDRLIRGLADRRHRHRPRPRDRDRARTSTTA